MVAAIGAGAALAGGALSASGAKSAANAQTQAGNNALQNQMFMEAQNLGNQLPYIQTGSWANQQIQQGMGNGRFGGNFTGQDYLNNQDPGYGFQLSQGQQALQNSQAAGSGVLSGAALKGLIGYNQGMAATGYQSAYDRWLKSQQNAYGQLHDMVSIGENAAAGSGNSGASYANGVSSAFNGIGNAQAAGAVGTANAMSGALSNGAGYYALNGMLNNGSGGANSDTGFNGQNNPANQAGLDNFINRLQ